MWTQWCFPINTPLLVLWFIILPIRPYKFPATLSNFNSYTILWIFNLLQNCDIQLGWPKSSSEQAFWPIQSILPVLFIFVFSLQMSPMRLRIVVLLIFQNFRPLAMIWIFNNICQHINFPIQVSQNEENVIWWECRVDIWIITFEVTLELYWKQITNNNGKVQTCWQITFYDSFLESGHLIKDTQPAWTHPDPPSPPLVTPLSVFVYKMPLANMSRQHCSIEIKCDSKNVIHMSDFILSSGKNYVKLIFIIYFI